MPLAVGFGNEMGVKDSLASLIQEYEADNDTDHYRPYPPVADTGQDQASETRHQHHAGGKAQRGVQEF
jgi:hypothetical protein